MLKNIDDEIYRWDSNGKGLKDVRSYFATITQNNRELKGHAIFLFLDSIVAQVWIQDQLD